MPFKPTVNKAKCIGCGYCVGVCPVDLYEIINGKSVVKPGAEKKCLGCKACESCPQGAIEVKELKEKK